jgi:hypothetical protein
MHAREPSLVSAAARLALDHAPYLVVALYAAAEILVALAVVGRLEILSTALPIALLAALALARRRRARR